MLKQISITHRSSLILRITLATTYFLQPDLKTGVDQALGLALIVHALLTAALIKAMMDDFQQWLHQFRCIGLLVQAVFLDGLGAIIVFEKLPSKIFAVESRPLCVKVVNFLALNLVIQLHVLLESSIKQNEYLMQDLLFGAHIDQIILLAAEFMQALPEWLHVPHALQHWVHEAIELILFQAINQDELGLRWVKCQGFPAIYFFLTVN